MGFEIISIVIIVGILFILLAMGLEIAWAVGIAAAVALVLIKQPLTEFGPIGWENLNQFSFIAVPLFLLMGAILGNSGVAEQLFNAVDKWVGRFPGGLACSVIGANGIFAAMCGSSVAAVGAFGRVAYPAMEKRHYDPKLALGSIAVGSLLSQLIPPSVLLIIYGVWNHVSIVSLFAAGLLPGILLLGLLMLTVIIRVKLNPSLAGLSQRYSWKERLIAMKSVAPFVALIAAVLGGILGGVMTPAEAGAVGAFLSIVLTLAYRRLTKAVLMQSLLQTVKVTSMAFFIMVMALTLTHALNIMGITLTVRDFVVGLHLGKFGVLAIFYVMYFFLGMFLDAWSMLFLTFSFVMPIITAVGVNPIWFGVIYVMAGEQSLVTPPYGLNLFVLRSVVPQHTIGTIVRGALPFLIPVYATVLILMLFPEIALWLPSLLGR